MRGTEILSDLADAGLATFGVGDLSRLFGLSAAQARGTIWMLHDQGYTQRLKRNVYVIRPVQDWGKTLTAPSTNRYAAAIATAPDPSYLAYYSAMEIHRMTQHPLRSAFVAVRRQTRARAIGDFQIRFVTVRESRFFGFESVAVAGETIPVSVLERTIVDGLDRPELCGGIEEVYRGFARRIGDVDPDVLDRMLVTLAAPVVTKRLGLIAELVGATSELVERIESRVRRTKSYAPLDPMRPVPAGSVRNKRWELAVNVSTDRLRSSDQT